MMHRSAPALAFAAALALLLPLSALSRESSPDLDRAKPPRFATSDGIHERLAFLLPHAGEPSYPSKVDPSAGQPMLLRVRSTRSGERVSYHGFQIVMPTSLAGAGAQSELAAVERQIEIVESVGLSAADLQLFRAHPIRISNGLSGGGHYSGGTYVTLGNLTSADVRPVLLHEYMHVLHHHRFPGGVHNETILNFYQEALANNLYPEGSYMLLNPGEFFAMTASCFLNGTVARPPYTRDAIRAAQPDYYAYLGQLFGRAGASAGRRLHDARSAWPTAPLSMGARWPRGLHA